MPALPAGLHRRSRWVRPFQKLYQNRSYQNPLTRRLLRRLLCCCLRSAFRLFQDSGAHRPRQRQRLVTVPDAKMRKTMVAFQGTRTPQMSGRGSPGAGVSLHAFPVHIGTSISAGGVPASPGAHSGTHASHGVVGASPSSCSSARDKRFFRRLIRFGCLLLYSSQKLSYPFLCTCISPVMEITLYVSFCCAHLNKTGVRSHHILE